MSTSTSGSSTMSEEDSGASALSLTSGVSRNARGRAASELALLGAFAGFAVALVALVGISSGPKQTAIGAPRWFLTSNGNVITAAGTTSYGSLPAGARSVPLVGLSRATSGTGYYEVSQDGSVYAFGRAPYFGSMQSLPIAQRVFSPVTALAPTPDGGGYWEVDAMGYVYGFGDAAYFGSVQDLPVSERVFSPVVQIAPTPDGRGYWEVDGAGYIYAFGDARLYGYSDVHDMHQVVADMAVAPHGDGYWVVTTTGVVHAFGGAKAYRSTAPVPRAPVIAIVPTSDGRGYWLVTRSGHLTAYGDASRVVAPRIAPGQTLVGAA